MSDDSPDILLSDAVLAVIPAFQDEAKALACRIADAVGAHGASYAVAGSVAAHILLTQAWIVALVGKLAEGGTPDPEHFYQAARDAVGRVTFNDRLSEAP